MRLQKRRRFELHGAQPSETPCFNMVAERANGSNGRSDSEREGSVQHDLPGKQQRHIPERELQRQRFLRTRRIDSRDIQNKFENIQKLMSNEPSETDHLGLERAQCRKTSPKTVPIPTRPETGSGQEVSARTFPSRIGRIPETASVRSEANNESFRAQRSAGHKSGGRDSTIS